MPGHSSCLLCSALCILCPAMTASPCQQRLQEQSVGQEQHELGDLVWSQALQIDCGYHLHRGSLSHARPVVFSWSSTTQTLIEIAHAAPTMAAVATTEEPGCLHMISRVHEMSESMPDSTCQLWCCRRSQMTHDPPEMLRWAAWPLRPGTLTAPGPP